MPHRKRSGAVYTWTTVGCLLAVVPGLSVCALAGPPCPCPSDIELTAGDQYIVVEWQDPPAESLYSTTVDVMGWTGNCVPAASGFQSRCDNTYELGVLSVTDDGVLVSWTHSLTDESFFFTIDRYDTVFSLSDGVVVSFPLAAEIDQEGLAEGWGNATPTLGGFYVGADSAVYTLRALAGGTVAETAGETDPNLDVHWEDAESGRTDTLTIVRADTLLPFDRGLKVSFAPGEVMADSTFVVRAGQSVREGEDFLVYGEAYSGYRVWRAKGLDLDAPELIRTLTLCGEEDERFFECENPNSRFYVDGVREHRWSVNGLCDGIVIDTSTRGYLTKDVTNAFAYYYAVTTFDDSVEYAVTGSDPGALDFWRSLRRGLTVGDTERPIYASAPPRSGVSDVRVRPNPYHVQEVPDDWEQGQARVVFEHLPSRATIYVYNVVGELVVKLEHDNPGVDFESWNLESAEGRDVVSGVYIFKVESPEGEKVGKFIIIR